MLRTSSSGFKSKIKTQRIKGGSKSMDANIQQQLTGRKILCLISPFCHVHLIWDASRLLSSPVISFHFSSFKRFSSFRQNKYFIQSDISARKPISHSVEEHVVVPPVRWGEFSLLDWQLMWLLVKLICDLKPCFTVLWGFFTSATPLGSICFIPPLPLGIFGTSSVEVPSE